jgi:uncharacterized cupredoxin-like copper-binding protein
MPSERQFNGERACFRATVGLATALRTPPNRQFLSSSHLLPTVAAPGTSKKERRMRLRQAVAIPAVAAIALSGAVALGGCGSDSNAATSSNGTTTDAMHGDAMKHESDAMKHQGKAMKHEDAMKHQGDSMKHEGSSSDHMEG